MMKRLAGEYQQATGLDPKRNIPNGTSPIKPFWLPAFQPSSRSAAMWMSWRANALPLQRHPGSSSMRRLSGQVHRHDRPSGKCRIEFREITDPLKKE